MRHEWRSSGLSNASPSSSESPTGLIADATAAVIDRRTIDWSALLERMPRGSGRALVERLRVIEAVRESSAGGRACDSLSTASRPAWIVAALAWLHTLCSLAPAVAAIIAGAPVRVRAPQLALTLTFTAASFVLAGAVSRDARGLPLLAVFAASGTAFARVALASGAHYASLDLSVLTRGVFPEAFGPACLWEFARAFPRVCRFTRFDRVARSATVAAWALGGILFAVNLALAYGLVTAPIFVRFTRGEAGSGFWKVFAVAMAPAAVAIFVRARAAKQDERQRVLRLSGAIAAGTAPFLVLAVLRTALPALDAWFLTASGIGRRTIDIVVTSGLSAVPVLSTFALLVDRPFEHFAPARVGHRLRRIAVHVLILAPFALLAITIYRVRDASLVSVADGATGAMLLACMVAGAGLVALRRRMLDARARPSRAPDMEHELTKALVSLRSARGARELADAITRGIVAATGAQDACLLIATPDGTWMDAWRHPALPDGAIVAMLRESTQPLDVAADGPLAHVLPQAERAWLEARRIELVVPVRRGDGWVVAIVACHGKRGGARFDSRDRWFLTTLAAAAGASWDSEHSRDRAHGRRSRRASAEVAFECLSCGMVKDFMPLTCGCKGSLSLAALPHRLAGTFVVERRLGSGGMGVVYLARDTRLDRLVALKTLPRLRAGAVAPLRREARAMARLNHPSLATIYGLEMWRGTPVLVVEYFPAGTLADLLAVAPMTPAETVDLGIGLTLALDYMHTRGVLHRDLKPRNVAMTPGRLPVLLDFGLAACLSPEPSPSDAATNTRRDEPASDPPAGTHGYLPPEAYDGVSASRAFDLWALAVVMQETLIGSRLEPPLSFGFRNGPVVVDLTPVRRRAPDLVPFFERALARDANRRFQTALEMEAALMAISGGLQATRT